MTPLETLLLEIDREDRTRIAGAGGGRVRRAMRTISAREAQRAIYIDFEGYEGEPPSLIGILQDDAFEQVVLSQDLASAAETKGIGTTSGATLLGELLARALEERRRICAFSEHELHVTREHWGIDLEPVYVNARLVLKHWWNRLRPCERPGEWSQAALERCMGISRPKHLRSGNAARRLRDVRAQLQRRGSYPRLTTTVKGKWTKLLDYNRLDVDHMAKMVRRAARDLE